MSYIEPSERFAPAPVASNATLNPARSKAPGSTASGIDAHIGMRMRLRRIGLGLSQAELATALGVTFQQVQKYESGTNRLAAGRLFALAEFLNVPVGFFYDDMPKRGGRNLSGASRPSEGSGTDVTGREALELMRAFERVTDPGVRRCVLALVRSWGTAAGQEGQYPS